MVKILYLILFYLIYRITDVILLLVMLVQTILNIFAGEPSDSIKVFGKGLGAYLQQISEFLSYASDEKPFPFSDWPAVQEVKALNEQVEESVSDDQSFPEEVKSGEVKPGEVKPEKEKMAEEKPDNAESEQDSDANK